jgi:hypothetical protein
MTSIILVATLIADPAREPLTEEKLDRAAKALAGIERRRRLKGVARREKENAARCGTGR